jgi:hypothetical protein
LIAEFSEPFCIDTTYTMRVEVTPRRAGALLNSICVYWDGEPVINNTSDGEFFQGTVGVKATSGPVASSYFSLSEIELFFIPASYDLIGLGNAVSVVRNSLGTGDDSEEDGLALVNNNGIFLANASGTRLAPLDTEQFVLLNNSGAYVVNAAATPLAPIADDAVDLMALVNSSNVVMANTSGALLNMPRHMLANASGMAMSNAGGTVLIA